MSFRSPGALLRTLAVFAATMRTNSRLVWIIASGWLTAGCVTGPVGKREFDETCPGSMLLERAPAYVGRPGDDKPWHLDLVLRTGFPKLSSTEQKLDRRLDIPLRADVFGVFGHPRTPIDRKTDLGLNTVHLGLGRRESDLFTWTVYVGGGAASDSEHQRFLIANLSTRFRYAYYYAGAGVELYPWGTPRHAGDSTWLEWIHSGRPYLSTGVEVAFLNAEGAATFALAPLTLYDASQDVRDWLFAVTVGVGFVLPLDESWSVNLLGDYRFHVYRPEEYNGWNIMTGLRYRF